MNGKFSLETVLTIRRNEESVQAGRLEAIRGKKRELAEKLGEVKAELAVQARSLPGAAKAFELLSGQRYRELLYRRLAVVNSEIEKTSERERLQRETLAAAVRERKKIERLRELWADRLRKAEEKAEALQMDETARFQFAREER